jgi:hypothetical protein
VAEVLGQARLVDTTAVLGFVPESEEEAGGVLPGLARTHVRYDARTPTRVSDTHTIRAVA